MQTQRTDLWTQWGKKREGQIERVTLKHNTLPYVKQIVNGYLLYHAGSSNMVLSDNLERWDGMGGRRHMYTYG